LATAFTVREIGLLDRLIGNAGNRQARPGTLSFHLIKLAQPRGYLAGAGDSAPGMIVIWRGLSRLTDIEIVAELGLPRVSN
jgi:hypothetical protein